MRVYVIAAAFLFLGACARADRAPGPAATARPLLIEGKGVTMPLEDAVRQIAFRSFVPTSALAAVAVIPPLGNADTHENRGIAFEYAAGGGAMLLLSQWPAQDFGLVVGPADLNARRCSPVRYAADAVIWSTRSALVMTLQPDGKVSPGRVAAEARRLLARGACG
ncbi:MAG TPA: hypothetical protein VIG51_06220 [Candidatus Baltobacteraceae bacterium]